MVLASSERTAADNRGQVILLMAIVLLGVIFTSVLLLNEAAHTSIDRSEGLDTQYQPNYLVSETNNHITSLIVTANHRGDTTINSQFSELSTLLTSAKASTRVDYHLEQREVLEGTHLYNYNDERFSPPSNPERTLVGGGTTRGAVSGGIHIQTSTDHSNLTTTSDPITDDTLEIHTKDHTMYIYHPATETEKVAMFVDSSIGENQTIELNRSAYTVLDLGAGTFGAADINQYDNTDLGTIQTQNGHLGSGQIDIVIEGNLADSNHTIMNSKNGIYGIKYQLSITTDKHDISVTDVATHSPFRGDDT